MAIKSDYISGTLTITQGSTTFTGTGTGWRSAEFKEGDTLIDITGATEYMGVIEAITGEASGTLTKAWEGPSLVNVPYRMRYQPDGARSTAQARNLIEILGNGNITAFALLNGAANLLPMFTGPGAMTLVTRQALVSGAAYDVQVATLADRAAYDGQDQGYAVLVSNVGDGRAAIYSKNSATSGDWSDPAYITGAVGPVVQIEAGTTTTLEMGQPATVVVRPITDGYALDFGIPRGPQGTAGADGADGAVGATGPRGEGLQIGATGTLAGRDAYDNEAEGFSYVDIENGNLYFRMGAPGNWSDPIPFGKGDKGDPGDSGAVIVTTDGVGNGTAGPYTLTEAPISTSATWASISGVTQYDFTLSGNQITFGIIVEAGIPWQVKSSGVLSVVEPADGSVGASKINTGEAAGIRTAINAAAKPATATAGNLAVFDANREVQDTGISKSTTAQAQAGTNDTNYMTPLKTAQAILALSPPTDVSGLYSSVSALALSLADLQGSRLLMNGGVADPFDDESGIAIQAFTPGPMIPQTTGVIITDFTTRATAQNDGVTNQAGGVSAAKAGSPSSGYSGKNYSSAPKRVAQSIVYGANDTGLIDSANPSVTLSLYGKNGSAPTNGTDGSLLGTLVFTDTTNESAGRTVLSSDGSTFWDYVWVNMSKGDTNTIYLAEIQFYEPGSPIGIGSSNQVYDPSLDLYKPFSSFVRINDGSASAPIGNVTTVANINDNDPTTTSTWTGQALNSAPVSGRRLWQIDLGSVRTIDRVELKSTRLSSNSVAADNGFYTSEDGVTWTLYGSTSAFSTTSVDYVQTITRQARYVAWVIQASGWAGFNWILGDFNVYVSNYSNMTLISTPYPSTAVPTQGRLVVQLDTPLTLVSGDFDGAISRDGGTTWINTPLTLTGTVGNIKTYESLSLVDFTGPTGSSLLFRVRTLTNKNIPVSGVVMQWK